MTTRFKQLIDDVADESQPLSGILLRARVLASDLKTPELRDWVKSELDGYASRDDLPAYRVLYPQFFGTFTGPFGAATKNVPLGVSGIPEGVRDVIAEHPMFTGVGAIEDLYAADTDMYNHPKTADVVGLFRRFGPQITGETLNAVEGVITKQAVRQVLSDIRSRFLEFLIELSERHPELKTDDDAINQIPVSDVSNAMQVIVHGSFNLHSGGTQMGDTYNVGQAGAMGPGSHAENMTFQQIWNSASGGIELNKLATELRALSDHLSEEATSPEHHVAIGNVQAAAAAADANDGPKTLEYMKAAGKWVWDKSTAIGTGVAIAAAKEYLGY